MNFDYILHKPAFVIHIQELSPERREFFTDNITKAGFTDMRIFEGINCYNNEILNNTIREFNNIKLHENLSPGQKGCLLSHLKLYKYIIENNIDICTIFEDDVHFHPNWDNLAFNYYNNTPKNFDIIFIGNQIDTSNKLIINNLSTYCTHAYIITFKGAQKLLRYLLNWDYYSKEIELCVGHKLTGLFCIDIMIKNIQDRMNKRELKKNINWYCWNGTIFPCKFNNLPLIGFNVRNSGLVFQNENFMSIVSDKREENKIITISNS